MRRVLPSSRRQPTVSRPAPVVALHAGATLPRFSRGSSLATMAAPHIITAAKGADADHVQIKTALLSVSDKTGLVDLGKALATRGVKASVCARPPTAAARYGVRVAARARLPRLRHAVPCEQYASYLWDTAPSCAQAACTRARRRRAPAIRPALS